MEEFALGIVCSLLAAIFNSMVLIFFKIRCVQRCKIDAFVFSFYVSLGSLLMGFLVIPFLRWNEVISKFPNANIFVITWHTWLSGFICGSTSGISYLAISGAGVAIGHGIWSAMNMACSYAIGIIAFGDQVHSIYQNVIGVVTLVIGCVGLISCPYSSWLTFHCAFPSNKFRWLFVSSQTLPSAKEEEKMNEKEESEGEVSLRTSASQSRELHVCSMIMMNARDSSDIDENMLEKNSFIVSSCDVLPPPLDNDISKLTPPPPPSIHIRELVDVKKEPIISNRKTFFMGIVWAVITGVVGGCFMIPSKISSPAEKGLAMLPGFSVGAVSATSFWLCVRILIVRGVPNKSFNFFETIHWGMVSGVVWIFGFIFTLSAKSRVGFSVAFMLTHLSLIFTALWSILIFHEIRNRFTIFLCLFFSFLSLVGSYFLLVSTSPATVQS